MKIDCKSVQYPEFVFGFSILDVGMQKSKIVIQNTIVNQKSGIVNLNYLWAENKLTTYIMSKFITVTIAKESEEDLEMDTPVTINTHYIIKIMRSTEDEHGFSSIALATGEFLFVTEPMEDLNRMLQ